MKILLVNNDGQTLAQVNDVENYDGTLAGHTVGILDLLEFLIGSAKQADQQSSQHANHGRTHTGAVQTMF